jgi:aldehyde dehydrogenase
MRNVFFHAGDSTGAFATEGILERPSFKPRYDNFIGGKWTPPVKGEYFDNISPIDGKVFTQAARSTQEDVDLAITAAHTAFATWSKSAAAYRSNILLKIAQVIEDNLEYLARVETVDNGKAIRSAWITSGILPAFSVPKKVRFPNTMPPP